MRIGRRRLLDRLLDRLPGVRLRDLLQRGLPVRLPAHPLVQAAADLLGAVWTEEQAAIIVVA